MRSGSYNGYNFSKMINQAKDESLCLIEHVRALENINNSARGKHILTTLKAMGLKTMVQEQRGLKIKNIMVDFSDDSKKKRLLISAHYDVVRGSPGANDNASGVSVLLGLCQELKNTKSAVKIVFFDREEAWLRTPILRLGLLGSLYYVWRAGIKSIGAVFNIEFCGWGDCLVCWPIGEKETKLRAFKEIKKVAKQSKVPFKSAHIPWFLLSSDHLSFRLWGFSNALTLSLLPSNEILQTEKSLAGLNFWKILVNRRRQMPEPLKYIHSNEDVSSRLNEGSLQLMLALLRQVIQDYNGHQPGEN